MSKWALLGAGRKGNSVYLSFSAQWEVLQHWEMKKELKKQENSSSSSCSSSCHLSTQMRWEAESLSSKRWETTLGFAAFGEKSPGSRKASFNCTLCCVSSYGFSSWCTQSVSRQLWSNHFKLLFLKLLNWISGFIQKQFRTNWKQNQVSCK